MLEEENRSASARGNLQDVTSLLKRGAKVAPDSVRNIFGLSIDIKIFEYLSNR